MRPQFSDTSPEAECVQVELLRQLPPWRKLDMINQLYRSGLMLMMSDLCRRYPEDPPARLRLRLAERLLGRELATKVYGQLPE
jgi:hypothetical protein